MLQFLSAWFDGIRWRELTAIVSAAWFGAMELAQTVGVPATKQQYVALAAAGLAAVCYLLNPKYAAWVEALPNGGDADSNRRIGFLSDPYHTSPDKEANNA